MNGHHLHTKMARVSYYKGRGGEGGGEGGWREPRRGGVGSAAPFGSTRGEQCATKVVAKVMPRTTRC